MSEGHQFPAEWWQKRHTLKYERLGQKGPRRSAVRLHRRRMVLRDRLRGGRRTTCGFSSCTIFPELSCPADRVRKTNAGCIALPRRTAHPRRGGAGGEPAGAPPPLGNLKAEPAMAGVPETQKTSLPSERGFRVQANTAITRTLQEIDVPSDINFRCDKAPTGKRQRALPVKPSRAIMVSRTSMSLEMSMASVRKSLSSCWRKPSASLSRMASIS